MRSGPKARGDMVTVNAGGMRHSFRESHYFLSLAPLFLLQCFPSCHLCVSLIKISQSPPLHPISESLSSLPPRTYASASGNCTQSHFPPTLKLCASGVVEPSPRAQRWTCHSRLIQGVTFPWPLGLVHEWACSQIRATETSRLSL